MLITGLASSSLLQVTAQTFTALYSFSYFGSEGASPQAGLVLSGATLCGTAAQGGSSGNGTVFAVNTDGTGFTNLHSFAGAPNEGGHPFASLFLSGNTLYGTTSDGGSSGNGTVFKINSDGTGFTNLHGFTATHFPNYTNSDGAIPYAGLILSGNTLYGTASAGGSSGNGTVFALDINGASFTNLYTFTGSSGAPHGRLILSGNTLYGTTVAGGNSGNGAVFKINTDGAGYTNFYSFSANGGPNGGLILLDNALYGTTVGGGSSSNGMVFKINTDGTGFTILHSFGGYPNDGASPYAGLVLSSNTLYGTTYYGGRWSDDTLSGSGTVFALNTDGTGFASLHNFTAPSGSTNNNSDGSHPYGGLVVSDNMLYGTTVGGGSGGNGAVFSLSLQVPAPVPQLRIILAGENVILTWQITLPVFILQSTTNLIPPVIWRTVSPGPIMVNGQNTVSNPLTGAQNFYRLSQ